MHDVYDITSGLSYCAMTSQPHEAEVWIVEDITDHHRSLKCGLGIVAGFVLCVLAIVIAI